MTTPLFPRGFSNKQEPKKEPKSLVFNTKQPETDETDNIYENDENDYKPETDKPKPNALKLTPKPKVLVPIPAVKIDNPRPLFGGKVTITEASVEDVKNYPSLSTDEIVRLKKLISTLSSCQEADIMAFGSSVNQKLASQVDQLLRLSLTPLEDAVKRDLQSIVTLISNFKLGGDDSFWSKFKSTKVNIDVNAVLDRLAILSDTIHGKLSSLHDSFKKYEELSNEVAEAGKHLTLHVQALEHMCKYQEQPAFLNRYENRLNDLTLSMLSTTQTLTQITVTKNSKLKMQENIRNLIEITIPAWKKQLLSTHTLSSNGSINDSITKLDEEALNNLKNDITKGVSNLT